jgi:hypothetical protein
MQPVDLFVLPVPIGLMAGLPVVPALLLEKEFLILQKRLFPVQFLECP